MTTSEYQQLVEFLGRQFTEVDRRFTSLEQQVSDLRREVLGHFDEVYRRLERLEQEYQAITQGLRRIEALVAGEATSGRFWSVAWTSSGARSPPSMLASTRSSAGSTNRGPSRNSSRSVRPPAPVATGPYRPAPPALYETGLAHAIGRRVLLIRESAETEGEQRFLFDISAKKHLVYSPYKLRQFDDEFERQVRTMKQSLGLE